MEPDCTISEKIWRCYERGGPAHDGEWQFKETVNADDADSAARTRCVNAWASGTHSVLVVNSEEARVLNVTIEAEEVANAT